MRYFYIEKVDCKSYILYNFYESLKGDILIQYIKYEDGTNNLEHLLSFDLSEEFLIPIVEEMISESESKFDQFGYSANFFQVDEFKSRHKRRIRNNKFEELGI
jgi:hypothetical protein